MTSHQGLPKGSNARLPPVSKPSGASYPDAYRLAINLARSFGASTIIDLGFAAPCQLMAASEFRRIIVDRDLHSMTCHVYFPNETWIDWHWPPDRDIPIPDEDLKRAVIVCAGVITDIHEPTGLLAFLRRASRHASAIIVCAPERELQGLHSTEQQPGSWWGSRLTELLRNLMQPAKRLRGWNLVEFKTLLQQNDLCPTFIGLTIDNEDTLQKSSIIAIIDGCTLAQARQLPDDFRPLVLTSTFNDGDIALEIVQKLLDDGMDVIVHDNWSDDGTFEQLAKLASTRSDLSVVRFPESGPSKYFELTALLRLKEHIAATYPGRWIIHHDSDEIRCSPWPDLSLRQGLYLVDLMGFTAVDFTVCGFRPIDERFAPGRSLERQIHHFEFSHDPADFIQAKAWRQSSKAVELVHTAGHEAYFPERRIFPYKFLLKHYPLRNPSQARRKIFIERRPRFAPEEREAGWHYHYDVFSESDSYVWSAAELIDYEASTTRFQFLVEFISGIGIVRDKLTARAQMPFDFDAKGLSLDLLPPEADDDASDDQPEELPRMLRGAQQQTAVLMAFAAASDRFRDDAHSSENNSREELTHLKAELQEERDKVAAVEATIQLDRVARYRRTIESISAEQLRQQRNLIADSGWFDVDYYLEENPDVRLAGVDPIMHYLKWGAAEGRNPSPRFDGGSYLDQHPDVSWAGSNPLVHYLECGMAQGRKTKPVD